MKHMKKILSFALVLVMVLSCMPIQAFAAENEETAYVAINKTTGKGYESLAVAMSECRKGETVALQKDASEGQILVPANGTLDLNGCTLEAEYMSCFGSLIDGSDDNSGLLKTNEDYFMIREDNKQLPIKDGTGYRFVEITKINTKMLSPTKFVFQPLFEAAALDLIAKGGDVTGLTVQVLVSWKQDEGYRTQQFVYDDNLLTQFLDSYNATTGKYGKMFTLTLNNVDGIEELSFAAVLASSTKVTISSAAAKEEVTGNVTTDANNQVVDQVILDNGSASAVVSTGTQLVSGTNKVTLSATEMTETTSNITLGANEQMQSMNVHVEGVSVENVVPILVTLDKLAPEFLNQGNLKLYHVENGETVEMTRVYSLAEVDEHNEFYYDIATGTVTMALATFSEIAVVSDTTKAWEGKFDYTWYTNAVAPVDGEAVTEYIIANADQLAAFGAIVGGMNGQTQDSFAGKTVKLIADINLGDKESENNPDIIFYPIGYYNSEGTYERTNTAITSGLRNFEGIFDGNGHTVSNFYQNTWEMKGDHDWYSPEEQYYRDGMGLFGRVYGGTVKNLTVENFSSDGEIATTGAIAAYADFGATFENITIFNCNPRVYNIGNGGIVGCVGWYTKGETETPVTFRNITVDNSNKISALWGSYDVACGGIVGQYYPTSGQSSANYPVNAGIHFENCHVAAQMDVYNDVCANYQYYAYRYTGMLIGSVRENETIDGHVYPKMDGITATDCTVHFGDWNDYYYCELVANSLASYTHDHQFSRLEQVASVDAANMTITTLKGDVVAIPTSGRVNYVVVNGEHATENATCYHFVDGKVHNHDDYNGDGVEDYETVNGESIRVENNRHIYLEFNNLVTGYGWGVTSKGVGELDGVTILDRVEADSVKKFEKAESAKDAYTTGSTITIGELFEALAVDNKVAIQNSKVQVFVSPADETSTVTGIYTADTSNWANGELTLNGVGAATITITDYYYSIPVSVTVTVTKADPEYTVPTGLTATYGQILENVELPAGFTWKDPTQSVGNAGANTFVAIYTPADTANYNAVEVEVSITVGKADPEYTVPIGLTATYGQILENVELPAGFTWKDPTQSVGEEGTKTFAATFTPADTANYNTADVEISVEVVRIEVEKFVKKFDNPNFTYRIGNGNAVKLDSLFAGAEGATIGTVTIDMAVLNNATVSSTYTPNNDWKQGTIKFDGTGKVTITITDNDNCIPTELTLEVVDATNATTATSTTSNNVVLLNDTGFSSLEVSGGYALFGNGFTLTCGSDSYAADLGYSFVTLNNGILDNVQIVCPNFDYAALYKSNLTSSDNRSYTDSNGTTRYYNARSAVMVSGNSQILNSRISGGRAALNISSGDVVIENSRVELGAVATILVGSTNSLTLRDVTLVQRPTASDYDSSKVLMGFSVLVQCTTGGISAPITLEGVLTQVAWADESDKQYVPEDAQPIVEAVMEKTEYLHDLDGDGTGESLNLGFAYMPADEELTVLEPTIADNRTNTDVEYDWAEVSYSLATAYVYSYKNTNGTAASFKTESDYVPNKYGDIVTVNYADTSDGLTAGKSFGTDGWTFELNVDLDKLSGYAVDFSKLSMSVNGVPVTDFLVDGGAKPTSPLTVTAGGTTYILTATVDGKEYTAKYKVTGTETSKESPSLVASDYEAGLCIASSYGGTWSGAAPALEGIQIKYWSVAEKQYKTINLADYTPTTKGQLNGTNTTWTYSPDNGDFTLTLTGGQVHSSNKVYAMPVCVETDGNYKLYFVAANSNGLVNSGNSARSIPVSYTFTDNNGGEVLSFSHSWSVAEDKDAQYKYSDFCNGTMTKLENCVTADTLITLADGTQKRVDELTGDELLLVWNLKTGKYEAAPIVFVDSDAEAEYEIIHLYFSDGSNVKVIYEHGFFDLDLGKYVYIDATNYADYVGHRFVAQGDIENDTWNVVTLDEVVIEKEVTTAWSPVTFEHLCYYTNGVLSMPGGIEGLFNIFEVDTDTMRYDEAKMQADIETYGLFTLEDFDGMITEEAFLAFNGAYLKVAMGKGLLTWEDIARMAERYIPLM